MALMIYILIICLIIAFSPRELLWPIAFISVALLSVSFLFFHPTIADDLYKHYIVLDSIRNADLSFYYLTEEFEKQSPVYFLYLRIISLFNNDAILPVISGIISYSLLLICIKNLFKDYDVMWPQKLCIILLILMTRLIDISSIRNILASSLFIFGLYYDLIYHKKYSIIFYILACLIHSLGFLYLTIRVLLILYNKFNKYIMGLLFIAGFTLISMYNTKLSILFSSFPIISGTFDRLGTYLSGVGLENDRIYTYVYLGIYIITLLFANFTEKKIDINNKLLQLYNYTVIFTLFTFGSILQRETFNRARFILIPLGILFLAFFLRTTVINGRYISFDNKKNNSNGIMEYGILLLALYIVIALFYFGVLYITTYNYYSTLFTF